MLPVKKIFCPIDFSEASIVALDAASEHAHHFGAELTIFHVLPSMPVFANEMGLAAVGYYPIDADRGAEAEARINSLIKKHVPEGVRTVTEVRLGDAPTEITSAAADDNADLIVIGTHGETGWRFLAIGSVAAKVVRMAHRPVLTTYGGPQHEE
ncbi:MAG: universal stress protein [Abditibacteriaceae bacterium]